MFEALDPAFDWIAITQMDSNKESSTSFMLKHSTTYKQAKAWCKSWLPKYGVSVVNNHADPQTPCQRSQQPRRPADTMPA